MSLRPLFILLLICLLTVSASFQLLAKPIPPFAPGHFTIIAAKANARASADAPPDNDATLTSGSIVDVTDRVTGLVVAGNSYWYAVTLPDTGATAHVYCSRLKSVVAAVAGQVSTPIPPTTGAVRAAQ